MRKTETDITSFVGMVSDDFINMLSKIEQMKANREMLLKDYKKAESLLNKERIKQGIPMRPTTHASGRTLRSRADSSRQNVGSRIPSEEEQ